MEGPGWTWSASGPPALWPSSTSLVPSWALGSSLGGGPTDADVCLWGCWRVSAREKWLDGGHSPWLMQTKEGNRRLVTPYSLLHPDFLSPSGVMSCGSQSHPQGVSAARDSLGGAAIRLLIFL